MSTADTLMTTEEFLALPDDGRERWLIRGQLRESEEMMTYRNRFHSWTEAQTAHLLKNWLDQQTPRRGEVFSGEIACKLREQPDTIVGIDIAYFSAETLAKQPQDTTLVVGAPVLAVEILSPSDSQEKVADRVSEYLEAGTRLVWVVDTAFHTITVHRPDAKPQLFNEDQEISGEPHLPGFTVAVERIFK